MKEQATSRTVALSYNTAVHQAYGRILKHAKQLLASLEQEELRFTLERMERSKRPQTVVHVYIMEMLTTLFRAKLTTGLADFWVAANAIKACTKIVI